MNRIILYNLVQSTKSGIFREHTLLEIGRKKMLNHTCLCCSNTLLRHIRSHQIYWFCPHCYQAMPETVEPCSQLNTSKLLELSVVKSYKVGINSREKTTQVPQFSHVA